MGPKIDKRLLWWIFSATGGGPVRARIVELLKEMPSNPNQITRELEFAYPTIKYHLNILEENKIVASTKGTSVSMYYITDEMEEVYPEFQKIVEIVKKRK
jgi:predicted transcriptional regulator